MPKVIKNKKLTDEKVIKGLNELSQYTGLKIQIAQTLKEAIDLIKRQKSEIERLKSANDEKFRQWDMLAEKTKQHYADLYNEAKDILKAEAYKEFAEELKNILRNIPKWNVKKLNFNNVGFSYDDVFFSIDNLLKEMLGEE
jgi:hypothetical protein